MVSYQERFIKYEIFSLTLMATVQRANVYDSGSSQSERIRFRSDLNEKLQNIAHEYKETILEETHFQHVFNLADDLSKKNAAALRCGRFRIGTAQKALNLYLKYLWCLKMIDTPPHCPFDRIIIEILDTYNGPSWTSLDSKEDYCRLVAAAKAKAQGVSLAVWELQTYYDARHVADG